MFACVYIHARVTRERERERESIKKQRVLKVKERIWVFIIFYTKPIRPSRFFSPTHNTHTSNSTPTTQENLHTLFRVFDTNHNHCIAPQELQSGLVAMGFSMAANPAVLTKLVEEIDTDRNGVVLEEDFCDFFESHTRQEIQGKLAEIKKSIRVTVIITEYGEGEGQCK